MSQPPILDPGCYPDGWNEERLEQHVLKLARDPQCDMTAEERLIAELGYHLRKSKDAWVGMRGVAQRRRAEIERLTGERMKALGQNRCHETNQEDAEP